MRSKGENFKTFEDFGKMAEGAFSSLLGARRQIKSMVKDRVDQILDELNLVSRAEFERVEAMAAKARQKQEELEKRLSALEKKNHPVRKSEKSAKKNIRPKGPKGQKK